MSYKIKVCPARKVWMCMAHSHKYRQHTQKANRKQSSVVNKGMATAAMSSNPASFCFYRFLIVTLASWISILQFIH